MIGRPRKTTVGEEWISLFSISHNMSKELREHSIPTYLSMSRDVWAIVPLSLLLLASFCLRVNTFNKKRRKGGEGGRERVRKGGREGEETRKREGGGEGGQKGGKDKERERKKTVSWQ